MQKMFLYYKLLNMQIFTPLHLRKMLVEQNVFTTRNLKVALLILQNPTCLVCTFSPSIFMPEKVFIFASSVGGIWQGNYIMGRSYGNDYFQILQKYFIRMLFRTKFIFLYKYLLIVLIYNFIFVVCARIFTAHKCLFFKSIRKDYLIWNKALIML